MRLLFSLPLLVFLLPLGGCAEGTAAPAPQTPVEVPQPRVLKAEVRPAVPAPVPAPKTDSPAKSDSTPKPAGDAAAQAVEIKKESAKSEPRDQVIRVPVGNKPPAADGRPVRMEFGRRFADGPGRDPGNGGGSVPRLGPPGDSLDDAPGFDRNRPFKTPPLPAGLPGWFGERDRDKDGQVGMYEWPRDQLDEFAKSDKNGDGYITPEELVKMPSPGAVAAAPAPANATANAAAAVAAPAAATPMVISLDSSGGVRTSTGDDDRNSRFAEDSLRRYDRNSDGKLDAQELERTMSLRNTWRDYDANKDGMLDLDEITASMKARFSGAMNFTWTGPPPGGRSDGERDRGDRRDRERGPGGGDMFGRFDQNRDGKITDNELPGFFRTRFGEWDANKDGALDSQELSNGMESMRRSFGGGPGRGRP